MKLSKLVCSMLICASIGFTANAAQQDTYQLPEPYLTSEKAYLKEFPKLQDVLDVMIDLTAQQLKNPKNDILHNRVCTALVFDMAKNANLPDNEVFLAVAGDLLHNIAKEDKSRVMTDPDQVKAVDEIVKKLRAAGFLKSSPEFWTNTEVFKNPKLGNNLGHIHHLTGAAYAGQLLKELGFTPEEITKLEAGIIEHSTGYWYFRSAVDDTLGQKGMWVLVFPTPDSQLADFIHDADLVSQFVYESVVPEGSKWRNLATKRWGAANTPEDQAFVVYYVFQKLFEEARTEKGRELAKAQWDKIAPELKKLMGLKPEDDPIKIKGVPQAFQ